MAELSYDVVVVGAGPAGSAAARAVAERGLSVVLVDKRTEIGRPVQCAEYVPRLIQREVPLSQACVAQQTQLLRTHLPGGESNVLRAPGFILDRATFDKHLAIEAVRAGADVMLRSRALERTARGLVVRNGSREREVRARVIIGADGASSTVGRWIDQRNASFVAAAQYELVMDSAFAETEVYFAPEYKSGYAWLFPKGRTANVGVGIDSKCGASAPAVLQLFVERLRSRGRIKTARAVAYTAGLVPVGGLLKCWAENVVLAGDAAGCVHPLTGAGILFAVVSGRLAGEVATVAVRTGDLGALVEYEARCREVLGGTINRGLAARRAMDEGWTNDPSALDHLVRQHWIAFDGCAEARGVATRGGDITRGSDEDR